MPHPSQPVPCTAREPAAILSRNSGGKLPRQYFSISTMNRGRSGSRSEKLIFVPSVAVTTRGPGFPCSLISTISPHRIRFSPRNQKRCSIASWDTTIVPGNENISAAAAKSMAAGARSCHHAPEPCRNSLIAAHAGKKTISGQAMYVKGSGENSTVPSPTSLAERARRCPRKCIHASRSADTKLAALSQGFQIIEIILLRRAIPLPALAPHAPTSHSAHLNG
jgi:hypothetical protein